MTLKIKWQKSKDKKYQVVYSIKDGVERYLGSEKTLLRMKDKDDFDKGKKEISLLEG